MQFGLRHQGQERQHQLVQRGHHRVRKDRRPVRIDSGGEILGNKVADPRPKRADLVPVGDHLIVSDDDGHRCADVLQSDPIGQRAQVVTEMQGAGGAVPGDDRRRRRFEIC